jgi:hypothetical protein
MIKDINIEKVEDLALAVVPDTETTSESEWAVYLVNLKNEPIDGVIVASQGYRNIDGKQVKTSTLRQFFDQINGNAFVKVELIEKELFALNNEFWISFWYKGKLFDKRYVFVTESISEQNFTRVPLIDKRGVMIK